MFSQLIRGGYHCIKNASLANNRNPKRKLWAFVAIAFNRVDAERLKLVGPDRLCAEWVLKNGGGVRFTAAPNVFVNNYNALPPESTKLTLKEIDASNSSVMKIGLDHLKNCRKIDTTIFHNCKHLEEGGLDGLVNIKDTLNQLEVSCCNNISDESLMIIKELKNLQHLRIYGMRFVKDLDKVIADLQSSIPQCNIETEK